MKSTILIYKNPDMPESGLRVASREEWTQILKANRGLPRDSRRFFICDSFEDCGIIDRIFIETSKTEYDRWHAQQVEANRKRKAGNQYINVSLETGPEGNEEVSYNMLVADSIDIETEIQERMELEQLKALLSNWRPWATDMMNLYIAGMKKEATYIISKKYGTSIRTVQRWKEQFDGFIKEFFLNQE